MSLQKSVEFLRRVQAGSVLTCFTTDEANELADNIERLEKDLKNTKESFYVSNRDLDRAEKELAVYKEALEFYAADDFPYKGKRAREALAKGAEIAMGNEQRDER